VKVLVTGGAGFIGSHLTEALVREGARVIVLDDLSSGRLENLAGPGADRSVEFVRGDAGDATRLRQLLPGCDWVFHQAALPSVPRSVEEPCESNRRNLEATLQLLVASRDAGVKRFLFASSSAIYGESDVPVKHEGLPPDPRSPYALQKFAAEKYGQLFHSLYGLETVSLRYFNVFGPGQAFESPYSGVIAKFCTRMLAGLVPVIFGDGRQSRDFVYIDNVVSANLLAAQAPARQVAGQVFNIAGGQSVSLLQLVAELNRFTRQELAPQFEPTRVGDVHSSQADITAAIQAFGYRPVRSWQEGLKITLDFYRRNGEASRLPLPGDQAG
jgi:nucleoside-diphosphate-sugar epimerase